MIYADGELCSKLENPALVKHGAQKYGHDSCHYVPGCSSTYLIDMDWIGAVFTLAPSDSDFEVQDDIYNIVTYHEILEAASSQLQEHGNISAAERAEVLVQVDLVLTTSYLATVRQVCCGAVRVMLTQKGMDVSRKRLRHVLKHRFRSQAALFPKRPTKELSKPRFEKWSGRSNPEIFGFNSWIQFECSDQFSQLSCVVIWQSHGLTAL